MEAAAMTDMGWRYCAHCDEFFWPRNGPTQKFCSAACSAKSQTRAPMLKSHRDPLAAIAKACANFIVNGSRRQGVTSKELAEYVDGYSALSATDRFRVNVLTCTHLGVVYAAEDSSSFRFWSKARQQQGEIIARAIGRT